MNASYRNFVRDAGQAELTHIGLFDGGVEISGGSPAYARQAVTWVDDGDGVSRPSADLTFDIPAGATVDEWRAFNAATGGTDYGGAALTAEAYAA